MDNLLGKSVVYIANSMWIVPAKIVRVYADNRCNLEIQDIQLERVVDIQGEGINVKVEEKDIYTLKSATRLNVIQCDPRSIIKKEGIPLDRTQAGGGLTQTHTDQWVEVAKSRLPKFSGISTSLIGKWFDPLPWNYQIYCYMEAFENKILKRKWEAIELILPKCDSFEEAFIAWFKESFESRTLRARGIPSSWSRCEIQALENDYVQDIQTPKGNSNRVKTNKTRASSTKSRKVRTREVLSTGRKG